jgi:hypothetical protein
MKLILFCFQFLITNFIWAQISYDQIRDRTSNVIDPSPNASAITRYGTIPVGLNTGIPEISIPIYEIKSGNLKLPISFSYHSSGIKVNDVSTSVGLGWSLNAIPHLTRTVFGLPDDNESYGFLYKNVPDVNASINDLYCYLYSLTLEQEADGSPDRFSYSTLNGAGQFLFTNTLNNVVDFKTLIIPKRPIKIKFEGINKITITETDGTIYIFGKNDNDSLVHDVTDTHSGGYNSSFISRWHITKIISADKKNIIKFNYELNEGVYTPIKYTTSLTEDINMPNSNGRFAYHYGDYQINYRTKLLTSIEFENGKVYFDYTSGRDDLQDYMNNKLTGIRIVQNKNNESTLIAKFKLTQSYFVAELLPNTPIDSYLKKRLRLDRIEQVELPELSNAQNNLKHDFEYWNNNLSYLNSKGQDIWGYNNGAVGNQHLLLFDINNSSSNQISYGVNNREGNFNYLQAGMIKSITYPTGGKSVFEFEPNMGLVTTFNLYDTINKSYLTTSYDYQNNELLISTMPSVFNNPITYGYITATYIFNVTKNQSSNYFDNEASSYLYDITNPSNPILIESMYLGASDFTTEQQIQLTKSVRLEFGHIYKLSIPQPSSLDPGFNYLYTIYSLLEFRVPTSNVLSTYNTSNYAGGLRIKKIINKIGDREVSKKMYSYTKANFTNNLFTGKISDLYNVYTSVNKKISLCQGGLVQHNLNVFTDEVPFNLSNNSGSSVAYSEVEQYDLDSNNEAKGKTVSTFSEYTNNIPSTQHAAYFDNSWKGGNLISESVFKKNSNSSFSLVQETINTFDLINDQSNPVRAISAYNISSEKDYVQVCNATRTCGACSQGATICCGYTPLCFGSGAGINDQYDLLHYSITSGQVFLQKSSTKIYNGSNFIKRDMNLFYENINNDLVTRTTSVSSNGNNLTEKTKYPHDLLLTAEAEAARQKLIIQNNVSIPLEITTEVNGVTSGKLENHYEVISGDLIRIKNTTFQKGISNSEMIFNVLSYDTKGNILLEEKSSDIRTAYIWDYDTTKPIAEIKNVKNEFTNAATSFEAGGKGNWIFTGSSIAFPSCPTGSKCYDISGTSITHTANDGVKYVISYWSQNGNTKFVNGIAPTKIGKTINGWTYFEHEISGITNINITGSGMIDELRLYPKKASMTTYTYEPLIGITSICNANNIITYYEYDGFNRLKAIRDQEHNIIKTFEYKYQQSQ